MAAHDVDRTVLGRSQERWLYRGLATEQAHWSVIAQQMLFANLELSSAPNEAIWSDFWDGYVANRSRLVQSLAKPSVRNAVVLGGDIHSWWASDVKSDYSQPESRTVGAELITTCLASRNPAASQFGAATHRNPHIRFMDTSGSGYTWCEVDRSQWRAALRRVDSLADVNSRCSTLARFVIEDRRPGVQRA